MNVILQFLVFPGLGIYGGRRPADQLVRPQVDRSRANAQRSASAAAVL